MKKIILSSLTVATTMLFVGCGGGSSSSNSLSGKLVDSPVVGADYECGSFHGTTASDGSFSCPKAPVTFKIGNVTLGSINSVPDDGYVTPYELAHTTRGNDNDDVKKIAVFMQGLDDDGSYEDAIHIDKRAKEHLAKVHKDIHSMSHDECLNLLGEAGAKHIPTDDEAKKHLDEHIKKYEDKAKESHSQKDDSKEKHQNDSNKMKDKEHDQDQKDKSKKEKDHSKDN